MVLWPALQVPCNRHGKQRQIIDQPGGRVFPLAALKQIEHFAGADPPRVRQAGSRPPECRRSGRQPPWPTSCRKTTSPSHSLTFMVALDSRGSFSDSAVSSWKWVANSARQRFFACRCSTVAQAIDNPSKVAVPRPISSRITSECGLA
jgi:hypothetical protein